MNGPEQIGEELRAARLEKGWSLEHAAYETRLRHDVLGRLEEGRYDLFPSHAYARGFIRIYARKLGLNDTALLKSLENALGDEEVPLSELRAEMLESLSESKRRHREGKPPRPQMIGLVIIGFVILIALGFGMFKLYRIWPALTGRVPHRLDEVTAPVHPNQPSVQQHGSTNISSGSPAGTSGAHEQTAGGASTSTAGTVSSPGTASTNATASTSASDNVRRAEVVRTPEEAMEVRRAEAVQPQVVEHTLRLYTEEECWARVTAIRKGREEVIFEGRLREESTFPPEDDDPWKAEAFIITLEEASVVDVIYDSDNYGKYEETEGRASFRLPAE